MKTTSFDLVGKKFNRLLVLEKTDKRIRGSVVWKCLCNCGNTKEVTSIDLKHERVKSCGCLNKEAFNKRYKNKTGNRYGRLTVIKKSGKTNKRQIIWECLCDCGNTILLSTDRLTEKSYGTKSCGCLLNDKISEPKYDLSGKQVGLLTVLDYIGDGGKWLCQCECGSKIKVGSWKLKTGDVLSCGCLKSKGEFKIAQILTENNIKFEKQKTFDSCRFLDSNFLAFFDFFVEDKYLIEYDGGQHFESNNSGWDTNEHLEKLQEHDEFKTNWCKENCIPLIRIPYTKFEELSINDLILN